MYTNRFHIAVAVLLILPAAPWCYGQASFVENFDDVTPTGTAYGPYELIDRGWDFRMQSSPAHNLGFGAPFQGWPWGGSQAGPAHIVANYIPDGWGSARANHWAILPPVPNQIAGDQFSVWMRAADDAYPARIEIRYSPGGGVDTGSGPDGVGDFTEVLLDLNPVPAGPWQEFTTTVPGSGRLALRYTVDLPVTSLQRGPRRPGDSAGELWLHRRQLSRRRGRGRRRRFGGSDAAVGQLWRVKSEWSLTARRRFHLKAGGPHACHHLT